MNFEAELNRQKYTGPVADDGLPEISLAPRHGQLIVTPCPNVVGGGIVLPENQLLREEQCIVLAAGPGSVSKLGGAERREMDLVRGDVVVMVRSDQIPDGSMEVQDPFNKGLKLRAVDEQSVVAKITGERRKELYGKWGER